MHLINLTSLKIQLSLTIPETVVPVCLSLIMVNLAVLTGSIKLEHVSSPTSTNDLTSTTAPFSGRTAWSVEVLGAGLVGAVAPSETSLHRAFIEHSIIIRPSETHIYRRTDAFTLSGFTTAFKASCHVIGTSGNLQHLKVRAAMHSAPDRSKQTNQ